MLIIFTGPDQGEPLYSNRASPLVPSTSRFESIKKTSVTVS